MLKPLLLSTLLFFAAGIACAQGFPTGGKPVRFIVPFPAGGQTDIQARAIAVKLGEQLKLPVVVDNKPGASAILGTMELIRSSPDGHTLLFGSSSIYSLNPHLFARLPYEPVRDLTPVMLAARNALVLVATPKAPFNTMRELIDHAKRNPGKLNFASFSPASTSHLGGEMLKQMAGIDMVHVPFKGSADANTALFGGQVDMMFDGPSTAIANAAAGRVKLIAYADVKRLDALPDLPTIHESGVPGFSLTGGLQFFAPAGMSRETTGQVNAALAGALRNPELAKLFVDGGNEVVATSADEHGRLAREWSERWGAVIRKLGLKLD